MSQIFTPLERRDGFSKKSFTLIELLVVLAIIGLLASLVLVNLGPVRQKARDAKRQSDIKQYGLAMEMYYLAQTLPSYPNLPDTATAIDSASTLLQPYLSPPLPLDPVNSGNYIYYWTDNNSPTNTFCVWAKLETLTPTTYVISNPKGTKQTTTAPTATNCAGL